MTNKIQRSLRNFNRILDDDYQKLSDKYQDLKLSHKRQEKLLKEIQNFLADGEYTETLLGCYIEFPVISVALVRRKILDELNNPLYRCRERKKNERKVN